MDVQSLPLTLSLPLALVAGLASVLSPCVLPILPTFLAWAGGASLRGAPARQRTALWRLAWFALGLAAVLTAGGVVASAAGTLVRELRAAPWVMQVAGIVFIAWGAVLLDVVHLPPLRIGGRPVANATWLGAFGFGALMAISWVPCIGPIYGGILTLAGTAGSVLRGTALLATYSVGLAVPFVAIGLAADRVVARLGTLARAGRVLRRVLATLIIAVGLLLLTGLYVRAFGWVNGLFPAYTPPLAYAAESSAAQHPGRGA